ncbi:MAG TPA: DUF4013 domain-containing protein, partial [Candidatus Dormibacteraeota bacterium]|nr:DUF4013 domain-containing protein [Candidatus Dormibacteraeota bacterium]
QGLIVLIPIIGWIAMTGWLMMAFESARANRNELPPAGFHLERGFPIFIVFLIYGIVLNLPALILYGIGGATSGFAANQNNAAALLSSGFFSLGGLLAFLGSLFLRFLIPSIIVNTYHGGFAGGFDVERVWRLATVNVTNSVLAGLIVFVAGIIGGLGFIVCCIGIIFTIPYENTITAAAAAWFERSQSTAIAPPPAPAT